MNVTCPSSWMTSSCTPRRWPFQRRGNYASWPRLVSSIFSSLFSNNCQLLTFIIGCDGFLAPYTSTRKEPDACVLPEGMPKPTLVVESGWSESRADLHRDRNVWLTGAATTTEVVLILKWSRSTSKKMKGDIEVWARDTTGAPILLQQEVSASAHSKPNLPQPTLSNR